MDYDAHSIGNLYVSDNNNNRVRKITVSTGVISTIAGSGIAGSGSSSFSGDGGVATSAVLWNPEGVTTDTSCNVYIVDTSNNRIRKVTVSTSAPRYVSLINYTCIAPSFVASM